MGEELTVITITGLIQTVSYSQDLSYETCIALDRRTDNKLVYIKKIINNKYKEIWTTSSKLDNIKNKK
jgi:hypothetical protein